MDGWMDGQIDREIDRQTDRQINDLYFRHSSSQNTQKIIHTFTTIYREISREIYRERFQECILKIHGYLVYIKDCCMALDLICHGLVAYFGIQVMCVCKDQPQPEQGSVISDSDYLRKVRLFLTLAQCQVNGYSAGSCNI